MLRPEQRNPAAPELLGSKSAGGAERFDRQIDDDQDDTSPASFIQSFSAWWIARRFGLSLHRAALVAILANLGRATDPAGGAE
jgi:hypothetical protein